MRSSAACVITTMLMRRLIGSVGVSGLNNRLEARPSTRRSLSSGKPPETSSRREALARSAESSQLL
ncbi:hypothetical protein FQZ97_1064590 [compost metagenome]